jgi:uncharacterized protein with FMN-binding domain
MKRAALTIVATVAGLVLLLSFKTHSTSAALPAQSAAVSPASTGSSSSSGSSTSTGTTTKKKKKHAAATPSSVSTAKTSTGAPADTQYGPVEVRVTVKNGKVTVARAVEYPNQDPRDAQINAYAIPVLNSEATAAGSARIDTVSGASYTSAGYVTSLQSALDKAGL